DWFNCIEADEKLKSPSVKEEEEHDEEEEEDSAEAEEDDKENDQTHHRVAGQTQQPGADSQIPRGSTVKEVKQKRRERRIGPCD
ncbi:unnamed protein product, partial [Polarella glacialis]